MPAGRRSSATYNFKVLGDQFQNICNSSPTVSSLWFDAPPNLMEPIWKCLPLEPESEISCDFKNLGKVWCIGSSRSSTNESQSLNVLVAKRRTVSEVREQIRAKNRIEKLGQSAIATLRSCGIDNLSNARLVNAWFAFLHGIQARDNHPRYTWLTRRIPHPYGLQFNCNIDWLEFFGPPGNPRFEVEFLRNWARNYSNRLDLRSWTVALHAASKGEPLPEKSWSELRELLNGLPTECFDESISPLHECEMHWLSVIDDVALASAMLCARLADPEELESLVNLCESEATETESGVRGTKPEGIAAGRSIDPPAEADGPIEHLRVRLNGAEIEFSDQQYQLISLLWDGEESVDELCRQIKPERKFSRKDSREMSNTALRQLIKRTNEILGEKVNGYLIASSRRGYRELLKPFASDSRPVTKP